MARTATRPLVAGRIEPLHGLIFGIALGALAFVQLALTVNLLAAVLAIAGLLGYVFLYTAWLKPRTPQNIVIGGAAGAMPPLVGWAAATGGLTLEALYPFAIVFLWTPPHFWALSLLIRDDYERTGVPMLPVVKGEATTRRQILIYAVILVAFTLLPVAHRLARRHLPGARRCVLGGGFVGLAVRAPAPIPRSGPPCGSTSARSPTWRCSSARWRSTGSSAYIGRRWTAPAPTATSAPASSSRRSPSPCSR